jgi:cytochrome c6
MKSLIKASITVLGLALLFCTSSFAADAGADTFKSKCAMCHGADGKGDTAMGKKMNLRDMGSADVQKQSDDELNGIITKGKNKMPVYGEKLSKDQISDLVKYIRTLKQ